MGKKKEKKPPRKFNRYGADNLYYALMIMYFLMAFIGFLTSSPFTLILSITPLFFALFRFFSKNFNKRRMENYAFMQMMGPVKARAILTKNRLRDIRTKRYRRCPHCKKMIRFPRKVGVHMATCPDCKRDFDIKIRF